MGYPDILNHYMEVVMLVLTRKENEAILIYPADDVDPDMTFAELFKDGPIKPRLNKLVKGQAKVSIDAARALQIVRDELVMG